MTYPLVISLPPKLAKRLERYRENYSYNTLEEVIIDILRERLLVKEAGSKGRPRRLREEELLTRTRVFSKNGSPIIP